MTEFRLTPPRTRKQAVYAEQAIHITIVDYLALALPRTWLVVHPANEGIRSKAFAGILKRMAFVTGAADLIILGDGHAYCMEVKDLKAKQTPSQMLFEDRCLCAGVPYGVVRSVEEAERFLRRCGVPLRATTAAA